MRVFVMLGVIMLAGWIVYFLDWRAHRKHPDAHDRAA